LKKKKHWERKKTRWQVYLSFGDYGKKKVFELAE